MEQTGERADYLPTLSPARTAPGPGTCPVANPPSALAPRGPTWGMLPTCEIAAHRLPCRFLINCPCVPLSLLRKVIFLEIINMI